LDFVLLAPGVSSSPIASGASGSTPLTGSGFTFGGLRSRSNNLSIDGLDNNDEYTGSSRTELSPEIAQEFQVVNNGLSAESGGASGGSINVITRSGTNTLHGDAFLFAQDGAFNARDPFETESGKPSFRRFRAGFALGGPLIKDKTFYYAAAEQEHNREQIGSDIDPTVASTITDFFAAGGFPSLATRQITTAFSPMARAETEAASKLDHQLTKNTALMLRHTFTNNKESGDAFNTNGLIDASALGSSFTSDNALSGSLTTVLGSEAISDLRFQAATRHATLRTNEPVGPEIDIAGLVTFGRPYAGCRNFRQLLKSRTFSNELSFAYKWLLANFANRVMMVSKFTSTEGPATMPTRNVNLTDELDRFVAKKVKTGRYENASEVVRAGLRTLEREEQQYEAKLVALRAAIDEGDASGVAEGDVFGRVRKALKLPASSR
jgi:putative addiction module CopG family antidote